MANTTTSALQRKLLIVTGKGGVGKTTIAAALGLAGAERGLRTIVVELGDQRRLPGLFANAAAPRAPHTDGRPDDGAGVAGAETALAQNLWSVTIDPDMALLRVAAGAGRAGPRTRARSQRHVSVLRRRRPRRERAREHGQDLGADPRRALAPARAAV